MPCRKEFDQQLQTYAIDAQQCRCLFFSAGEILIHQGAPVESLYFIVEGQVEAQVLHDDGRQLALCYTVSNGPLGDVELMMESSAAVATVIAQTDVICLAYPYTKARLQRDQNIIFVRQIAQNLTRKLIRSTDRLVAASLTSAQSQVCRHLLQNRNGLYYSGTLTDIAAATGISYRHIQRIIHSLIRDGIIQKTTRNIYRLDIDRLITRCQ